MAGGAVGQQGVGSQGMGGGMGGGMQQPLVSLPPPGRQIQQPLVSLPPPGRQIQQPLVSLPPPGRQIQQPAQIPFNQWVQSQNQDPNVPAMTTQQLQNKYMQEMGFGTGQSLQQIPPRILSGTPLQGGGFGLSNILPASDITALAEFARGQGGMPIQAPNGNFGVAGGAEQNLMDAYNRPQVSPPAGGPAAEAFFAELARNQGGTGLGGVFGGGSMGAPNSQMYDSYLRELANSGQRSTLPITPGPMRSTPTPARPLPPRPGPQVQPIRRPLPMPVGQPAMGGLAGLAGMLQGRK